jgi:hypothetical protein
MRPEWTHAREVIEIGAEWLRTSEQPADALLTHLGLTTHAGGGLTISFAPNGYLGEKTSMRQGGRGAVIVVALGRGSETGLPPIPHFTQDEIDDLGALIEAAGLPIEERWNGAGLDTGSFGIQAKAVSPTLNQSVRHYVDACPVHKTVFCGERARWGDPGRDDDYANCTWFSASRERLVEPVFPVVPWPTADHPAPGDDDSNLRAVKEALKAITPLLSQMGIHPATIVAGRRGHIEGDEHLDFVADQGHGVLLPAETAVRLVEAAVQLWELGA